jgi:hypothetical protein
MMSVATPTPDQLSNIVSAPSFGRFVWDEHQQVVWLGMRSDSGGLPRTWSATLSRSTISSIELI